MEKHFITALLVVILLAPQTGLEAKSWSHEVKERDHDAKERDHEDKNRYHKAKKRHHDAKKRHHKSKKRHNSARKFFRFARATKAELESLNQAIADVNSRIDELEQPGGELPAGLITTLEQLRIDVDTNEINISINESGVEFNTQEITQNDIAIEAIKADIFKIFKLIDELHPQPPSGAIFSGKFIGGVAPGADGGVIAAAWTEFTNIIGTFGTFSSIEIRSLSDGGATIDSAICNDPTIATQIATALSSSGTISSLDCGAARTWSVNNCIGTNLGVELRAGFDLGANACTCSQDAIVIRPLATNEFWGGTGLGLTATINPTCGEVTQTLEIILTPNL